MRLGARPSFRGLSGFTAGLGTLRLALGRPSLRLILVSYFFYCLARKASRVALVVYAFTVGGVRAAALVSVAQLLPAALIAPLGASVAGRGHPARSLFLGYLFQAAALAATGFAAASGAGLMLVSGLAAILNSGFTLTRPIHFASMPDVATHPEELPIGNAASAWVDGAASMIGPLLAGWILAVGGAGPVLWLLAVGCVVGSFCAARIVIHRVIRTRSAEPIAHMVSAGFREMGKDPDGAKLNAVLALQYVVVGLLDVLLVQLVVQALAGRSDQVSILAGAIGAGATLGASAAVTLTGRARLGPAVLFGTVLSGLPVMGTALAPGLWLAAALMIAYGAGKSWITVSGQTLLQRTIRDDVAARVFGVQEGLIQAATAIGAAAGPLLMNLLGVRGAVTVSGALLPLAAAWLAAPLNRLDSRASVPGRLFNLLRDVEFLGLLPAGELERLARDARTLSVPAGQPIITQGEPGEDFFVIEAGSADVVVNGQHVRRLGPGQGFGEIALLEDSPRTATVRASADCVVAAISRHDFLTVIVGYETVLAGAMDTARNHRQADIES